MHHVSDVADAADREAERRDPLPQPRGVRAQRLAARIDVSEHVLRERLIANDRIEVGDEDLRDRLLPWRQEHERAVLTEHAELVDTWLRMRALVLGERVQPGAELLVRDGKPEPD